MYPVSHDFRHAAVLARHDTPMQRKLRHLAPMACGVVFLPWPGLTEAEARAHFRLMKQLGFNCLKQTMPTPEWPTERTLSLALEEGILPFWYAEGGYEDITPELLTRIGLPADLTVDAALSHPTMIAHQHGLMTARIQRLTKPAPPAANGHSGGTAVKKDWVPGVVGDERGHEISAEARPHFIAWLRQRYGTIDALKAAWNATHVGLDFPVWKQVHDWADLEPVYEQIGSQEYRHLIDAISFRAETFIRQYITSAVDRVHAIDPHEPLRAGGEMGLFLSFASRGTDMEGIAAEMARGGSFYPSLHLAWHFEEVGFEVERPVYMQAAIAADWAKGIWSAPWESTGGPQYFSGGKAPFVPAARDEVPGFTTDAGTMTQMLLSYLGGGFRGFGLWAWNYRTAGWEAGEYALLDRNNQPNERAQAVGAIATAMRHHRRELWQSHKEPLVGLLDDWESDAMWAAMAVTGRDRYRADPIRARIGASRALIDANVPWEHVTVRDLEAGLAPRYPVILIPAHICLGERVQELLLAYVEQGGRVVMDMPSAYLDSFGRILTSAPGSLLERLFGVSFDEFGYSHSRHRVVTVPNVAGNSVAIDGFTARVTPTTATVAARFHEDGVAGLPAVTVNRVGKGTAVVCAFQAALSCWKRGNDAMQALLIRHTLGDYESPYRCAGVLCYRLAGPEVDHYFLINTGAATTVHLDPWAFVYRNAHDAVSAATVVLNEVAVPAHSGRWIRCIK